MSTDSTAVRGIPADRSSAPRFSPVRSLALSLLAVLPSVLPSAASAQQLVWGRSGSPLNTEITHSLSAFDSKGGLVTVGSGYALLNPSGEAGSDRSAAQITTRIGPDGKTRWTSIYRPVASSRTWITIDGLLVDAADNTYAAGTLYSPSSVDGPGLDFVIQKIDPLGKQLWSVRFGSEATLDILTGVALDGKGGVIVCGTTDTGAGDATLRTITTARFDAQGRLAWSVTHSDARAGEQAAAVTSDRNGGVFVAGTVEPGRNGRPLLLHYGPDGALLWEARPALGAQAAGPLDARPAAVVTDKAGACYLCVNALDGLDGYTLLKYAADGRLLWRTQEKAPALTGGRLVAASMALDTMGGVAVGGTVYKGRSAYVVSEFRPTGKLRWSSSFLSDEGEMLVGSGVGVDSGGSIYMTGLSVVANGARYRQQTVKLTSLGASIWRYDNAGIDGSNAYLDFPSVAIGSRQQVAVTGVTQRTTVSAGRLIPTYDPATYILR